MIVDRQLVDLSDEFTAIAAAELANLDCQVAGQRTAFASRRNKLTVEVQLHFAFCLHRHHVLPAANRIRGWRKARNAKLAGFILWGAVNVPQFSRMALA